MVDRADGEGSALTSEARDRALAERVWAGIREHGDLWPGWDLWVLVGSTACWTWTAVDAPEDMRPRPCAGWAHVPSVRARSDLVALMFEAIRRARTNASTLGSDA